MVNTSIKKNLIINALQQIVSLVLPIATVPYLARVLGAEGVGIYSYTDAIVQYFILFGSFGLTLYGTRQIAYTRDDKLKVSLEFWKIFLLKLILTLLAIIVFIVYIALFETTYKKYMYIQILALLSTATDISWFYHGTEEFERIFIQYILFKILGFACIFIFVKDVNDVAIYIFIMKLVDLFGNLFLWKGLFKRICFVRMTISEIVSTIKPATALFIPQIAIEIYVIFDKSMLGWLSSASSVGIYSKAEQFAKLPLTLVAVLGTVMFPRMSNLHSNKDKKAINQFLNISLTTVAMIGIGSSFGLAAIASDFIPWMLGEEFLPCIRLLYLLAPLAYVIGSSNIIGKQYLITTNREKTFTVITIIGACCNLFTNLRLIPSLTYYGAAIATLLAESIILLVEFVVVRHVIFFKEYGKEVFKMLCAGIGMFFVVKLVGLIIKTPVINTLLQIFVGVVTYTGLLIVFRETYVHQIIHIGRSWIINKTNRRIQQ